MSQRPQTDEQVSRIMRDWETAREEPDGPEDDEDEDDECLEDRLERAMERGT